MINNSPLTWDKIEGSEEYNLHYGLGGTGIIGQYGEHGKSASVPTYSVDDGYVRTLPTQSERLHQFEGDPYQSTARFDVLRENGEALDLSNLFTSLNTIVVEDAPKPNAPTIAKEIVNLSEKNAGDAFSFTVRIKIQVLLTRLPRQIAAALTGS